MAITCKIRVVRYKGMRVKDYFIYDGRANYDVDEACIVQVFDATSDEEAKKHFKHVWEGVDVVLMDSENKFICNET